MVLDSFDFKNYLADVTDTLLIENYPDFIKKSLKPEPNEVEKGNIITACENLLSVLIGNTEILESYHQKEERKRKLKKLYGNKQLNKNEAIIYTGLTKSTFEKKVNKEKIKDFIDGKPYFKIDELEKIMKAIIDCGKSTLCIETHYCLDRNRMGFLPFTRGRYYKIVDEDERFKYLFNEEWKVILKIGHHSFRHYFQVKEDLEFLLSQFDELEE